MQIVKMTAKDQMIHRMGVSSMFAQMGLHMFNEKPIISMGTIVKKHEDDLFLLFRFAEGTRVENIKFPKAAVLWSMPFIPVIGVCVKQADIVFLLDTITQHPNFNNCVMVEYFDEKSFMDIPVAKVQKVTEEVIPVEVTVEVKKVRTELPLRGKPLNINLVEGESVGKSRADDLGEFPSPAVQDLIKHLMKGMSSMKVGGMGSAMTSNLSNLVKQEDKMTYIAVSYALRTAFEDPFKVVNKLKELADSYKVQGKEVCLIHGFLVVEDFANRPNDRTFGILKEMAEATKKLFPNQLPMNKHIGTLTDMRENMAKVVKEKNATVYILGDIRDGVREEIYLYEQAGVEMRHLPL